MLKVDITANINADRMLDKSKIDKGQKQFVHLVATKSDEYVPFLTGRLKGSVKENKKSIKYKPMNGGTKAYASVQFNHNAGLGREGYNRGGRRGDHWHERMWIDHKNDIVREIANIIGGKPG